jgi:hypothetical protein
VRGIVALVAAALAAVIEVDHLVGVGETPEPRLEEGVVEARPPMQQQQCRLGPHPRTVADEAGTLDIEEQAQPADVDAHG